MSGAQRILGIGERFSEVLEAQIEAGEGVFAEPHPFLRTACRGIARRIGDREILPMGFAMATELYITDMNRGIDGFTGERMPSDVTGMPPMMASIVRLTIQQLGHSAFGEDFMGAVDAHYEAIRGEQA